MIKRAVLVAGLGAGLAVCGVPAAMAGNLLVTWSPTAVGLTTTPAGSNIVFDNINSVSDYADITIPGSTFTENAVITVDGFTNSTALPNNTYAYSNGTLNYNGLNNTYGFYAVVTASGTTPGIPVSGSGTSTTGAFTSASYTFYANPNGATGVTINNVANGAPSIKNAGGSIALFGGSLISGTDTLTAPAGGGYSPQANLNVSLTACTLAGQVLPDGTVCSGNESAFFVNPLPQFINLVVQNYSATTTVSNLTPGNPTLLSINGGGGNITFATVPEPASLLVLSSGLLGLGMVLRRRSRS